jgi:hypothetical protein
MRIFWLIGGIVAAVLVVGFAVWNVGASRALDSAIAEADARYRILSVPSDHAPRDASNDAARALDDAVRRVGLTILPAGEAEQLSGTEGWGRVRGAATSHLSAVLQSGVDSLPPAPDEVRQFLAEHSEDLDEAESLLLDGGDVRFASWPDGGLAAPMPNLYGVYGLTRLLALRALEAARAGDHERAWRALQASWRLQHSLADQPHLICRLITVAGLKTIVGTARRLPAPVPEWYAEVAERDPSRDVVDGLRAEMHMMSTLRTRISIDDFTSGGDEDGLALLRWPLERPLLFWDAAFSLRDMTRMLDLGQRTDPCELDPARLAQESIAERPWWANVAIMMPNIASAMARANQARLDLEATTAVLDIRSDPHAFTERPSNVCAGHSWKAEPLDDGAVRVSFSGAITTPDGQPESSILPTAHTVSIR